MNRILLSAIRPQTADTVYVFYDAIDDDVITQLKKWNIEDPVAVSGPSFMNSEKTFFAYNVVIRKMYSNFTSHRGVGITGQSTSLTNTGDNESPRYWKKKKKKKFRPSASLYDTPILLVMKRILPTDSLSTESSTVIR